MDRFLISCVVLFLMLAVAPAASASPVDAVVSSVQACSIDGTSGTDRLAGTGADDVVCARGGADRVGGGRGADVLLGGAGGDLLQGKSGPDRLAGGPGNDRAFGGAGADELRGGPGRDALGGGLGPDKLSGGAGRDIAYFGQRTLPVRVSIGAGANDGVAGEGDNVRGDVEDIQSGGGNDVLSGSGGANRLLGGGGRDRLDGGRGNDVLEGGAGSDRLDARDGGAGPAARQIGAQFVDQVVCGEGEDTALVDPSDVVDPDCENVVGRAPGAGNQAPTGIALSNASVAENALAGTTVGALSAGDPDPGDTHAFELVPGAGSDDNGSFSIVGSTLRTAAVFNHEAKNSYTVRIRATDFGTPAGQIVRTFTIAVNNVNEGPTVTASGGTAAFIEGGPPVAIDPGITVDDPDPAAMLTGATVDITNVVPLEDSLVFTDQNGITGVYDAATGVLTLSGMATVGSYQTALRSVTYDNSSQNPSATPRTLSFQVTDAGGLSSNPSTRDVTVASANDAPVVTPSAGATAYTEHDPATAIDNALTVTDADDTSLEGATVAITAGFDVGDELVFTDQNGITGSLVGDTLTLTGTATVDDYQTALRSVRFRHLGDDPGTSRTVRFIADDGDIDSQLAFRTITITPINDAPTLDTSNAALAYPENAGLLPADAGITVTDPDSSQLQGATVQITSNFVAAQDELAFTNQLTITGTYNDTTGTLTLTGTASVAEYQAALRAVRYENSSDDPNPPARTLTFRATDTEGAASAPATRDITLGAANDAATITTTAAALAYTEGDPATVVDSGLIVNDPDDATIEGAIVRISAGFDSGDDLVFVNQAGITGVYNTGTGVLTLTGTSSLGDYQTALSSVQYRHTGDNPATVKTVEFRADDGDGLGPASTRNIAVTRVNDAPAITTTGGDLAYTENAGPVAIDGGLTVGDPDSAELSGATVAISSNFQSAQDELGFGDQNGITGSYNDTTGVLTLSGAASVGNYQTALRSVTYTNVSEGPSPLTRTVTFQATDSDAAASNLATRGIAITAVNDPPTAVNDSGTTDEDTTLNIAAPGVLANDTDVDPGDTKTVDRLNGSVTLTGTSAKGAAVTINANGSYTYNPGSIFQGLSTGQNDIDSFTYRMSDGGGASSTATVNLTITGVSDAPVANADSFDAIGNTALSVGTTRPSGEAGKVITGSVLANDTDVDTPQANLVVEAGTFPTTLGGSITIEADGNFTYHPDDGDIGADSFIYTVSDGVASDTGTLSLPLAGQVWYVQNNEPAGGDGTSDTPFDTLAEAETASGAGDTVYVFDGDNTAVDLDTGFAMEANERLIGEHNGVSLAGHLLHAGTTNAHPTLTATSEDVVVLASGATVDGVTVDPAGAGGGISGGAGAVTINDVNVADGGTTGTQPGVDLDGTTAATVTDLTVSTNGATGVRLNNAGATDFGTTTITSTNAPGLDATGTNMSTSTFDAITVTGSSNGGVSMNDTPGTTVFGDGNAVDLALTTSSGTAPAFRLANAGTVTVAAAGTDNVSANGGPAVDVTGTTAAALAFDDVDSTNSATDGINLAGFDTDTFSATSGDITGAAGIAFDLDGGNGAVTYPGAIGDGTGASAKITNRTGGTTTLSGAITDGADAGGGINLTGNTGATIDLTGGMTLSTGTSTALNATGGGTFTVTGAANTLTTSTATALNVANTNIGANDLTFRSVASNGAGTGVSLTATGSAGGLTVTGNGGTCSSAATCTGGAIQNSTGPGMNLTSVGGGVSLTRVSVNNGGDDGIRGTTVNGFSIDNSRVTSNGNAVNESGLDFVGGLTGTASVAASLIDGSPENGMIVTNPSGSLNLTVTGSTLNSTSDASTGNDGLHVDANDTANITASVTGSTFNNNRGDHFQFSTNATSSGTNNVTFSNNTLVGDGGSTEGGTDLGAGMIISPDAAADTNYTISNNNIQGAVFHAIGVAPGANSVPGGVTAGTISGNTIGTAGTQDSGSAQASGIAAYADGDGVHTTRIENNQIRQWSGFAGIDILVRDGSPTYNATITGNTIANPGTFGGNGILLTAGAIDTDAGQVCAAITGNTLAGAGGSGTTDFRLRQRFLTTVRLPGYAGAAGDTAAVVSFVQGNNPGAETGSATVNFPAGGGGFVGGAACPTP